MRFYCLIGVVLALLGCLSGCSSTARALKSDQARSPVHSFIREDGSMMYFIKDLEFKNELGHKLVLDVTVYTSDSLCNEARLLASLICPMDVPLDHLNLTVDGKNTYAGDRMFRKPTRNGKLEHRYEFQVQTPWVDALFRNAPCVIHAAGSNWSLTKAGSRAVLSAQLLVMPEWQDRCLNR